MLILLTFFVIALLIVWGSRAWSAGYGRRVDTLTERMEITARICEAAARDTCNITLNGSLESIETLDVLIDRIVSTEIMDDGVYVLGAYLGQVLVVEMNAKWVAEKDRQDPMIILKHLPSERFDPFDAVTRKLNDPNSVSLDRVIRALLAQTKLTDATAKEDGQ